MVLGLLPAIRGGLGELARTGQHSRLVDGYLRPYSRAFETVSYFSYLRESLDAYTDDAELRARVRVLPGRGWHPWLYTLVMPFCYSTELSRCAVLRVFQVTGAIPAVVARRRFGVPFVTTYGFWYGRLARSHATALLRRVVEALALRAAAGVIVTTPELGAHVAALVGKPKVHLIPNGVDTTLFAPRPRAPRRTRTVLYVGRLSEEKNLGLLLEAAGQLTRRVDLRLVLVGQGPLRALLEARAQALGVAVEFVPVVDHRALPGYLAEADAFVLPSFTEGHPKVLLEAMSAGVPCLASSVDGNRAIVDDGDTGFLFDPRDAGALADRLRHVLAETAAARAVGVRGRARVVERYDLARLVEREIALLKRVASPG